MGFKRMTGRWITRREAAVLGTVAGYAAAVVFVSPLLLGFLPLLAVIGLLRVPVESDLASSPAQLGAPIEAAAGSGRESSQPRGPEEARIGRRHGAPA